MGRWTDEGVGRWAGEGVGRWASEGVSLEVRQWGGGMKKCV